MGTIYSILEALSTAEGVWAIIWRVLGLRLLARAILVRGRKVKGFGFQFYQDRGALERDRSWSEFIRDTTEIDALLVIGDKVLRAQQELHKFKRLILPNPNSGSLAFYANAMDQLNTAEAIRGATREAQRHRIRVRWCPEFSGYSMMIVDQNDSARARVHIEHAFPGLRMMERPVLVVHKKRFPDAFVSFKRAFDALWDASTEPTLEAEQAGIGETDADTQNGGREERRALAETLHDLLKEAMPERNRLIRPQENFDYGAERQRLVEWSNRVVEHLQNPFVAVGERSDFEILGEYEGEPMNTQPISEGQLQIQTMWTEKFKRLRPIITRLGS